MDRSGDTTASTQRDLSTLARGGVLNLVGAASYGILNFALVIVVSRGLGVRDAGAFFEAVALFTIASNAAELGTDTGLVRMIARYRALDRDVDLRRTLRIALVPALAAGILLGAAGFVLAPELSKLFEQGQEPEALVPYLRLLAFFLPLSTAFTVAMAATRGFGTMRPTVLLDKIAKPTGQVLASFLVIAAGYGSVAIALAYVGPIGAAMFVGTLWLIALLRRAERGNSNREAVPRSTRDLSAEFWRFTTPRALAGIFQVATLWLGTLLVGAFLSATAAAVYTASSRFMVVGQFALAAMIQAVGPQISGLLATDRTGRAQSVYQTGTWWLMLLTWPAYLIMIVFSPTILRIFGEGFEGGASVLVILSLAMLVSMACGPVDVILLMGGKSWWSLMNSAVALLFNIGLSVVLIPRLGINGAAVALMASIVARNLLPLFQVSRMLRLDPFGPGYLIAAVAPLLCYGAVGLASRALFGPSLVTLAGFAVLATGVYLLIVRRFRSTLHLGVLWSTLQRRGDRPEVAVPDPEATG
ncbi:flippase [soil metagenome]